MSEFQPQPGQEFTPAVMGVNAVTVKQFLDGDLDPNEWKGLSVEQQTKLQRERYVPSSGPDCDLDLLERFVSFFGRTEVTLSATNEVYRKYGNVATLKQKPVEIVDGSTLETIERTIKEIVDNNPGVHMNQGEMLILEKISDGKTEAKLWPYVGFHREPALATGGSESLKQKLSERGVKPWRVGTLGTELRGAVGETVAVFIGK